MSRIYTFKLGTMGQSLGHWDSAQAKQSDDGFVSGEIELTIDLDHKQFMNLGLRALRNKNGRSQYANGAIKIVAKTRKYTKPGETVA